MDLKQVEVKENETAVDNLFIFTIMEINEEIDDAQTESQLRGIYELAARGECLFEYSR